MKVCKEHFGTHLLLCFTSSKFVANNVKELFTFAFPLIALSWGRKELYPTNPNLTPVVNHAPTTNHLHVSTTTYPPT